MEGPWEEITFGNGLGPPDGTRRELGKPGRERRCGLATMEGPKVTRRRWFIVQLVAMQNKTVLTQHVGDDGLGRRGRGWISLMDQWAMALGWGW